MANSDPPAPSSGGISDSDIDALLAEMNAAPATPAAPAVAPAARATPSAVPPPPQQAAAAPSNAGFATTPLNLPDLQRAMSEAQSSSIDLLRDVELNVKIELGRSRMLVEDVLKLAEGSVVELDKLAGDPVDVYVNERLVARGEVLVLNDSFCVRVNEIVANAAAEIG